MVDDPLSVYMSDVLNLFSDENCRRTILTLKRTRADDTDPYVGKAHNANDVRKGDEAKSPHATFMWQQLINRCG